MSASATGGRDPRGSRTRGGRAEDEEEEDEEDDGGREISSLSAVDGVRPDRGMRFLTPGTR